MKRITNKGFTLIELMIVLIILAILIAMVTTKWTTIAERAKKSEADALVAAIKTKEGLHMVTYSAYTDDLTQLDLNLADSSDTTRWVGGNNTYQLNHFLVTLITTTNGYTASFLRRDYVTENVSNKYGAYTMDYDFPPGEYSISGGNCGNPDINCEKDILDRQS